MRWPVRFNHSRFEDVWNQITLQTFMISLIIAINVKRLLEDVEDV